MRRLLNILAAIMVAGSASATLDVRHYYLTNDVSAAAVAVSPLKWQQGESVKIDLYARRGTTAIDLTGVTTVRMETTHPTNLTQLYMCETGTVASATNGYVTFDISPANANLPTSNLYTAYMRCYTYTNSENRYVGDIYKGPVYVLFGPSATNVIWRGPYTNAVESDPVYSAWSSTNAWLTQAATTAQGYVNGASNNLIRLQTNDLVTASNALAAATAIASTNLYGALNSASQALNSATIAGNTASTNYASGISNNLAVLIVLGDTASSNYTAGASNSIMANVISGNTASSNYTAGVSNNAFAYTDLKSGIAGTNLYGALNSASQALNNATIALGTASSNYTAGVSNNAFAYTDLKSGIAGTNQHNLYVAKTGDTMTGDLHLSVGGGPPASVHFDNGGGTLTNNIGIVSPQGYLQNYWSDGNWYLPGHAQTVATPAALMRDSTGLTIGTNVKFAASIFGIDMAGSQISGGTATGMTYYGNGAGVTNLPMLRATAGVLWFTESSNGETTELYHITSTYKTNKIGSFWTTP